MNSKNKLVSYEGYFSHITEQSLQYIDSRFPWLLELTTKWKCICSTKIHASVAVQLPAGHRQQNGSRRVQACSTEGRYGSPKLTKNHWLTGGRKCPPNCESFSSFLRHRRASSGNAERSKLLGFPRLLSLAPKFSGTHGSKALARPFGRDDGWFK
jgi:hypothetical protein